MRALYVDNGFLSMSMAMDVVCGFDEHIKKNLQINYIEHIS